jgi:hypothetical protein
LTKSASAAFSETIINFKAKKSIMQLRKTCFLLLILCLLVGAIGVVSATTQGLNVEAGKEFVYKINVAQKDVVHLSFVATGQADGNLSFSMAFPNSTVIDFGEHDQYSTSFTSDDAGKIELQFDNTNSSEVAFVALNYNIEHFIFGLPEMIFVLIAIAVLLMTIVTGYIIMNKYSN